MTTEERQKKRYEIVARHGEWSLEWREANAVMQKALDDFRVAEKLWHVRDNLTTEALRELEAE